MKVYLSNILNYFTHHITKASGISSRIALIEKISFGYRNKERMKKEKYFRNGNLELYPGPHTKVS
jgi:transposase